MFALFVGLLMVGCGGEEIYTEYHENGQKAVEGYYKNGELHGLWTTWFETGQKEWEVNYKDGKENGLETWWYSTGQKEAESTFKDGKLMSAEVWKPNGEKCPVTNIDEDGNGVWVEYNEDGTESTREIFKDGEYVED